MADTSKINKMYLSEQTLIDQSYRGICLNKKAHLLFHGVKYNSHKVWNVWPIDSRGEGEKRAHNSTH